MDANAAADLRGENERLRVRLLAVEAERDQAVRQRDGSAAADVARETRLQDLERTLSYYAERRNWREGERRDSYDGKGPGARARAALAGPEKSGSL